MGLTDRLLGKPDVLVLSAELPKLWPTGTANVVAEIRHVDNMWTIGCRRPNGVLASSEKYASKELAIISLYKMFFK